MRRACARLRLRRGVRWRGCPTVRDRWLRGHRPPTCGCCSARWRSASCGTGSRSVRGARGEPGSRRARVVERIAVVLHCSSVYVLGLGVLLLPSRRSAHCRCRTSRRRADPGLAAVVAVGLVPLAARALARGGGAARGDVPTARRRALDEQQGTDHVRTAIAKGVSHKRVIRRHAGPFARSATASLVGISAPIVVISLILVERVFAVQGFFVHTLEGDRPSRDGYQDGFRGGQRRRWTWRCSPGSRSGPPCSSSCSAFAMEFALLRLDPHVRTTAAALGAATTHAPQTR